MNLITTFAVVGLFQSKTQLYSYADENCVSKSMLRGLDERMQEISTNAALVSSRDRESMFNGMGHIGQVPTEIREYAAAALLPHVKTVCEIGFNAGHSAAVFLTANENSKYIVFDIGDLPWSQGQIEYIDELFPGRMTYVKGSSFETLDKFHAEYPEVLCDLWSIDGVHDLRALKDFESARSMSSTNGFVLADDHSKSFPAIVSIWKKLNDERKVETVHCHEETVLYVGFHKGWCLGRWLPLSNRAPPLASILKTYLSIRDCETPSSAIDVSGIVLSSLTVTTPDNQRQTFVKPSASYMQAFSATVGNFSMPSVIIHDGLPESFIQQQQTDFVRFQRGIRVLFDATSDRYIMYKKFLATFDVTHTEYIVVADLDVFFQKNAFKFMRDHGEFDLFLSMDVGTHGNNAWMADRNRKCQQPNNLNAPIWNAGFWGGRARSVIKIIDCMHENFRVLSEISCCDMSTLNSCISLFRSSLNLYEGREWSNPFRLDCDNPSYVGIHNKCSPETCLNFSENGTPHRVKCV
jgi:hypothetical protein